MDVAIVGGFGHGEEDEDCEAADQSGGDPVDVAPGQVDGDEAADDDAY